MNEFLHVDPERPFLEAVTVKPGLHWRHQVIKNANGLGYLPKIATDRLWKQPKRERNGLQLGNQERKSHLSKDVGFARLGFSLALV